MAKPDRYAPVTGTKDGKTRPWDPTSTWKSDSALELVERAREALFQSRSQRMQTIDRTARRTSQRYLAQEVATVAALILDALAHHLSADETALVIRLDKNWLASGPEDVPARNRTVNDHLLDLEAACWFRVNRSTRLSSGFVTTLSAGEELLKQAQQLGVDLDDIGATTSSEVIELRGIRSTVGPRRRSAVRIDDSEATRRIRTQMYELNNLIAGADISYVPGGPALDTRRRHLVRVFLDGSFERGGRTGGSAFWLNLPKELRRGALLINGERIAEVDLKAAVPSIAYGIKGLRPSHDPYTVSALVDAPRDAIKLALMQFLWSPFDVHSGRLSTTSRLKIPKQFSAAQVFEAIVRHNQPIAEFIGASDPRGAELQWHESEIIVAAAIASFKAGVPCLPLHDALLVPRSGAKVATAVLHGVFVARFGVNPEIEVTHVSEEQDAWVPGQS